MGLDSYLHAEKYISGWSVSGDTTEYQAITALLGVSSTNACPALEVTLRVAYWRKANQIHRWFVEKVQDGEDDCKPHYVSREKLEELRNECQVVLDNPDRAQAILPTESGFFFGSTEYDEDYLQDLRDTVEQLDAVLHNEHLNAFDLYYRSSW